MTLPVMVDKYGHDMSGPEINLTTIANLLNQDAGGIYYATDTKQFWVCQGNGIWQTVGAAGNVTPGSAGSVRSLTKLITGMQDATYYTLATITVPVGPMGGGVRIFASGTGWDGDSTQVAEYLAAISRDANLGVEANLAILGAAVTIPGLYSTVAMAFSLSGATGAVGATQTFTINAKITKTFGGSSSSSSSQVPGSGHVLVATVELANAFATGITIS